MELRSLDGCLLSIGSYPSFEYDARGGGGEANVLPIKKDNILQLRFAPEAFSIPALTWQTTKFLSLPLLPGLKIEMCMDKLEGNIDQGKGKVLLRFESRFSFSISNIFQFPELFFKTYLETGKVKGILHEEESRTIQNNGEVKPVGISTIPKTGNKILDLFLGLPNEALAVLRCEIK